MTKEQLQTILSTDLKTAVVYFEEYQDIEFIDPALYFVKLARIMNNKLEVNCETTKTS